MENPRVVRLGKRFKEAGASGRKVHVISKNGRWAILREGAANVVATYATKAEALDSSRKMLLGGISDRIVVHRADGTVEKVHLIK